MTVCIKKSTAVGTVAAPPSKSMAHRMLICAGLAAGESRISGISGGEDIAATIDCLRALGVDITVCGDVATVHGINLVNAAPTVPLCCRAGPRHPPGPCRAARAPGGPGARLHAALVGAAGAALRQKGALCRERNAAFPSAVGV